MSLRAPFALILGLCFAITALPNAAANPAEWEVSRLNCVALTDSAVAWAEGQVRVRAPIRGLEHYLALDGGSRILMLVDANGDSALLMKDGRMWISRDSTGAETPAPPRPLYYGNHWSSRRVRRQDLSPCPIGSAEEQAWFLILGDLVAHTLTPAQQDSALSGELKEDIGNIKAPVDIALCALRIMDSVLRQRRLFPAGTVGSGN